MPTVLRISDATTLALHATVMLAASDKHALTTREIAQTLHASEAHLSKVLQRLHKAGLVDSTRGPHGGFALVRPPEKTSLLRVYEAIEGKLEPTECLLSEPVCDGTHCIMGPLLADINRRVGEYLAKTMIADLTGIFNAVSANIHIQEDK